MLSLLGHLNFTMSITSQGRAFISRLLTLAHSVKELSDSLQLDEGMIGTAFHFSIMMLSNHQQNLNYLQMPPPSIGFGGFFQRQWFAEKWPIEFSEFTSGSVSSALYEIDPLVVASVIWHYDVLR